MDDVELYIGKMVRFHRRKAKLTQERLSFMAGVGKTVVFDIEKGKRTVKLSTLLAILHVLNIEMRFIGPLMHRFEESL